MASRASPTVALGTRPDRPATTTTATSASAAITAASGRPDMSSPVTAQPGAWRTWSSPYAARNAASGVVWGV